MSLRPFILGGRGVPSRVSLNFIDLAYHFFIMVISKVGKRNLSEFRG